MMTRRNLLLGASALGAVAPTMQSCSCGSSREKAARSLRRPITVNNNRTGLLRELVRYATLAPSSHNTQCWKFRIQERSITIEPDFSRRCPVVDPDDHHLFVSMGCSTENNRVAGGHRPRIRRCQPVVAGPTSVSDPAPGNDGTDPRC
jgi:hypothetical protein